MLPLSIPGIPPNAALKHPIHPLHPPSPAPQHSPSTSQVSCGPRGAASLWGFLVTLGVPHGNLLGTFFVQVWQVMQPECCCAAHPGRGPSGAMGLTLLPAPSGLLAVPSCLDPKPS